MAIQGSLTSFLSGQTEAIAASYRASCLQAGGLTGLARTDAYLVSGAKQVQIEIPSTMLHLSSEYILSPLNDSY